MKPRYIILINPSHTVCVQHVPLTVVLQYSNFKPNERRESPARSYVPPQSLVFDLAYLIMAYTVQFKVNLN